MIPVAMGWSRIVLPAGHSLTGALAELVLAELPVRSGIADGSGVLVVVPAARARPNTTCASPSPAPSPSSR